jgi:hypothetical protein
MPHTFAHPFFAAPLKRLMPHTLRTSGLVLGSMAPDFEYFAAMEPYRTIGHTFAGFFFIHLPLCSAAALVMGRLLLPTLPLLLPSCGGLDRFAERLSMRPLRTAGDWLAFIASLFIGFLTHLFMDGWTHGHTVFTNRFAWLHAPGIGRFVVYESLQFVLSALGAAAIALYVFLRWRAFRSAESGGSRSPAHPPADKRRFRLIAAVVMAVVLAAKVVIDPPVNLPGAINVAPFTALVTGWMIAALTRHRPGAAWTALAALLIVMAGYNLAEAVLPKLLDMASAGRMREPALTACWIASLWCVSLIAAGCAAAARSSPPGRGGAKPGVPRDWTSAG